jgi:integrase/recombinase XerD
VVGSRKWPWHRVRTRIFSLQPLRWLKPHFQSPRHRPAVTARRIRIGQYQPRRQLLLSPRHPRSVAAWVLRFLEALTLRGITRGVLDVNRRDLAQFNEWCLEREIDTPAELTKPILERYQRHLFYYRKANGEPLTLQRQVAALHHLRGFFRWLVKHNHLASNPAADLELPKPPRLVLPDALTVAEVEALLADFDVDEPSGLCARAMGEVLYSTGVRRAELCALTLHDIDYHHGTLRVRQGKGRKDRIVPIGSRALGWLRHYLEQARPRLCVDADERALFLTTQGLPMPMERLSQRISEAKARVGITKRGSCHLFRHTAATLMLENGADLRYIQEMLGHASVATTQVYTHVSIGKLKAIHEATHPGAKLERREAPADPSDFADRDD